MWPYDQPNPVLVTALSAKAVASAPGISRVPAHTINVEQSLIGRPVDIKGGKNVGTLEDVVAEIGNGRLDCAVVQQGGIGFGTTNGAHAIPWSAIKSLPGSKQQAIKLRLDQQQWQATPIFGGSKAQETRGLRIEARRSGANGPIP